MLDRHDARRPQRIVHIDPALDGPPHEHVDMSFQQLVRVLVVAAQHGLPGEFGQQRVERVEVSRGGAFADDDLAAGGELVERFFLREALVIGGDAGGDITGRFFAAETRRVAIDGLPRSCAAFTFARHAGSPCRMPGKFIISLR